MIPFAGLSIGSYHLSLRDLTAKKLAKAWSRFMDTVNYAEILPPVGSQQLSYAKFLELLSKRKIKRIILMDNATCAIVEVRPGRSACVRSLLCHCRISSNLCCPGPCGGLCRILQSAPVQGPAGGEVGPSPSVTTSDNI